MNKWMLVSTVALLAGLAFGCAKKDDGAPPVAGCPAGQIMSATVGCTPKGQCPEGLGQSNSNGAMCMDLRNGQNIMPQQCGNGQVLTVAGCLPECEGRPGYGQYGPACLKPASVSGYQNTANQYYSGQYQPAYGQQYYGYGYNPYGYRYW